MLKIEDAVSETLLITLYMRHLASNRPDPIIRDESASRLVAEIDYDFSKFDHAERSIIGTAIRADYFDKLAADFIRRQPNPVIVVIGCGLDGRRGRIGRAADNVPFYQLDLPEVIAIRRKLLPPQAGETLIEASDVLQYIWGKLIGGAKIMPSLSPSKTVSGTVGGIASATILAVLMAPITPFNPWQAGAMGLIICLMGFFGGLVMSAIKRDYGVKDWGNMIQGHGGMLDRVDSVCFAAPVFFHIVRYYWT